EDNEFRFQQLEGTGGGGPAPSGNSGALEPDRLPAVTPSGEMTTPAPIVTGGDAPMEGGFGQELGESSDPLVGTNQPGAGVLGGGAGGGVMGGDGGRPLDLSLDGGTQVSTGDASAQYEAGYDAIVRGDYAFAEDQFQQ